MKRQSVMAMIILGVLLLPLTAAAMDAQLQALAKPPGAAVIWEDKILQINAIETRATHLRTGLAIPRIISFYKDALIDAGWEFKAYHPENSALFFIKEKGKEFFYVMVFGGLPRMPSDIYLVHSSCDLTICTMLSEYMLQPVLAPDIPGKDLDEVTRYPQSRRRLSMFAANGAAFLLYEVQADTEKITHFLSEQLKGQGWTEADTLNTKSGSLAIQLLFKGEDILQITVMAAPAKSGPPRAIIAVIKNIDREVYYPSEEEVEG